MKSVSFISPIKMSPRKATSIARYAEMSGEQFLLRIKNKSYMVRANSIIGLLSCGLKKNDNITLYCDAEVNCMEKLLEMQREFESLA